MILELSSHPRVELFDELVSAYTLSSGLALIPGADVTLGLT